MDDLTGRIIKGYELQLRLGAGGFGAVYRAHQAVIEREVAIKVILPQYANQPEFVRRFETEAQLVARLEHLHIVPLHDYWRDPDGAYLVMRLLQGGSLRAMLNQREMLDAETVARLLDRYAPR
jgi:serine/threonine protein kinase